MASTGLYILIWPLTRAVDGVRSKSRLTRKVSYFYIYNFFFLLIKINGFYSRHISLNIAINKYDNSNIDLAYLSGVRVRWTRLLLRKGCFFLRSRSQKLRLT